MTFVVTAPCFGCKHTDCVTVCPADCFHEGEQMLYINPDECTSCSACAEECPERAIFYVEDVPEEHHGFIALNADMSQRTPSITEKRPGS